MLRKMLRDVAYGSFASILACPQRVRLGDAGCPVLPVEGIGSDVIQAPKPEPPDGPIQLCGFSSGHGVCWFNVRF
jgi:hypothetical protein